MWKRFLFLLQLCWRMAPCRSRTRRLVPQNPRRNRSVSNSGLRKNRNQSTWTHSKLKNIKAETIGDAMSKGKNWRDLSDDFNKLMWKCFMEQNLERSKCEKGRSGRYTWQRKAKPKQNAKYRYGSKTTVPDGTNAVKKVVVSATTITPWQAMTFWNPPWPHGRGAALLHKRAPSSWMNSELSW